MKVHSVLDPVCWRAPTTPACPTSSANKVFTWTPKSGCPWFRSENSTWAYRIDLLVENLVNSRGQVRRGHPTSIQAQILSYLRLSKKNVGLLINFHVAHLKDGIKRIVRRLELEK